jgi:hypothetical protein
MARFDEAIAHIPDLITDLETRKPDRRKLMRVIGEIQTLSGAAKNYHGNDRDPNGFEKGQDILAAIFQLCIAVRHHDPAEPESKTTNKLKTEHLTFTPKSG